MEDLKDIWNNNKTPQNTNDVENYLKNNFSAKESFDFESNLNEDDPFINDAIEGLKPINKDFKNTIDDINHSIDINLKKKKKKQHKKIDSSFISIISVLLILGLIIAAYFIISNLKRH